jgi:hypothetical protein
MVAVVAVSALVIILCVLGAAASGLFNMIAGVTSGMKAEPSVGPVAPAPLAIATRFDDGRWLVNRDILAGTYKATVPADSAGCTWERDSATDGMASSVLESSIGKTGDKFVVGIGENDVLFQSYGCGTWIRTGD